MTTEQYIEAEKKCGIKVGDKVKVISKCKSGEKGWSCTWNSYMDNCIGNEYTVLRNYDDGVGFQLETHIDTDMGPCDFWFPYFVLQKPDRQLYLL